MNLIVYVSPEGENTANVIAAELDDCEVMGRRQLTPGALKSAGNIIFVGALGICVRTVMPLIHDKYQDPAVICVDSMGKYAISVLSGHVGGGNDLCRRIARILGAEAVVTTQSDNSGMWALDTLGQRFGWEVDAGKQQMNRAIFSFVNGESTGLLLDVRDSGTAELERTLPSNVRIMKDMDDNAGLKLIIAVTPYIYDVPSGIQLLCYHPKVLNLGVGCRKDCNPDGVADYIRRKMMECNLSPLSLKAVATIELKKDERLVKDLAAQFSLSETCIFSVDQLKDVVVPNASAKVKEVTGVWGVSESCAIEAADGGRLIMEKQKGKLSEENDFTFAVAIDRGAMREGHIEIVGAGPGDPELVSVRGKRFLEEADLILYAGSLVPEELTHYAKQGCVVRSSASMNLEEQFALMKQFYDKGLLVVRLHTGDPCIYGAIQEQMAFFDRYGMSYHITPGISSFQAAAAELRSQFTIPEKVQSIILTRGEGRTPMPEKERLHLLARSQSTMCIYLSAAIVDEVQKELLMEYSPDTPVAACYKLTWKEQKIYRGQLKDLARIVHDNNLTLTTLLVVGDAIDNREGLSKLYDDNFKHLFRK
ncbi:MAG: precorrin-4 C(11)-methyltransferase [Bacteroidales bacterium]|nr:precorrin-4 C(11)-methyltransferase [Bacteroidales bacterium]